MVLGLMLRFLSRHKGIFLEFLLYFLALSCCCLSLTATGDYSDVDSVFVKDHLTPYTDRHWATRTPRDVSTCQHASAGNTSVETYSISTKAPLIGRTSYELRQFADAVPDGPLRRRYILGTIAFIENPYFALSVLEPNDKGGCKFLYGRASLSFVSETAANRNQGCRLAINAGYFNIFNGQCLGNVVSDGRLVQTAGTVRNANFGIREDGSMVVGYLSEADVCNQSNPFRQLVTGVIWLVRNGTNYVNESMQLESSEHEGTGKMETFVNVVSARTAVGYDMRGRLVFAQVLGQTHRRG